MARRRYRLASNRVLCGSKDFIGNAHPLKERLRLAPERSPKVRFDVISSADSMYVYRNGDPSGRASVELAARA